jgi:uncharacterized protein (TIGR02118 family)
MMNRREFNVGAVLGAGAITAVSGEAMAKTDAKPVLSLNVVYVSHEGARFDYDYYRNSHIPLAMKVMKADRVILTEGVSSPDKPAPIAMICRFEFSSAEALAASGTAPGIAEVRADVAKFTDIKPIVMAGKTV